MDTVNNRSALNTSVLKPIAAKPVKLKAPLESAIQNEICEALQARGIFFWRSNNIPSLGRFGVDGKARFRSLPKFTPKGIADILCVVRGTFVAMEVKRPGKYVYLRPEQAEWGTALALNGGIYAKVCSVEEALALLDTLV